MNLEEMVFKRKHPNVDKLSTFGFLYQDGRYQYSRKLSDDFIAYIVIDQNQVAGKVIDQNFEEEYINYRLEGKLGEFAAKIKYEYLTLLDEIALNCFEDDYFVFDQANRLANFIKDRYHYDPQFIFEKNPDIGVFKHQNNKWFGLVMLIDYKKIDENLNGEIEVLNLKVDENKLNEYLEIDGIYRCYHMNKKNWVTIALDDRVDDAFIYQLIQYSYDSIDDHLNYKEWVVPGNASYFDIENLFAYQNESIWKQSTNVHIGDIVYIYASKPFSCILFQCEVIQVDIPYRFRKQIEIEYVMKLKHLHSYEFGEFSLERLKEFGVNTIRGPRHIPIKLSEALHQY